MDFNNKNYQFSFGEHHQKEVIWISFPYSDELRLALKEAVSGVRWSAETKKWYVDDNNYYRQIFALPIKGSEARQLIHKIHFVNQPEMKRYLEDLRLRAYSPNTMRTYSIEFAQLLYFLKEKPVRDLLPDELRAYLLYCYKEKKLSENQMHSRLNAIKFYFEKVLKKDKFFMEIPRPKKPSILPKALSKKEIEKLFEVTTNIKHNLILKICYGMGLRVSEIVNLRIADIDSGRMLVHIQGAKGKKDRYVPLPETILSDLRNYYVEYKPKEYLFEGSDGGQYSIRSTQAVFKTAMRKAKIKKKIGIHGLRHSYATHLLEYGTDMYFIQNLLGHKNIKTTEIYAKVTKAHLSKVKSPLDTINKK